MRKLILPLFMLLVVFVGAPSAQDSIPQRPQVYTQSILNSVATPTVLVTCLKQQGFFTSRATGSGTVLNERFILTAAHVVDDATAIFVDIPGVDKQIRCEVVVLGTTPELDYAILQVAPPEAPEGMLGRPLVTREILFPHRAKLLPEEMFNYLETGDELLVSGHPLGGEIHVTQGLLCASMNGFYTTSAPIIYGNSGGGVYTHDYYLIGVLVRIALSRGAPICHINFMVPMSAIREALAEEDLSYVLTGVLPEDVVIPELPEETDEEGEEENPEQNNYRIGPYETETLLSIVN